MNVPAFLGPMISNHFSERLVCGPNRDVSRSFPSVEPMCKNRALIFGQPVWFGTATVSYQLFFQTGFRFSSKLAIPSSVSFDFINVFRK